MSIFKLSDVNVEFSLFLKDILFFIKSSDFAAVNMNVTHFIKVILIMMSFNVNVIHLMRVTSIMINFLSKIVTEFNRFYTVTYKLKTVKSNLYT